MNNRIVSSMNQAHSAFQSGRKEAAEAILVGVANDYPNESEPQFALGAIAAETGRSALAIQKFKRVIELQPHNPQANLYLGVLLSHEGLHLDSIEPLELAIKALPPNLNAFIALGQSYFAIGQPQKALTWFDKSLKLRREDPKILLSKASCLIQLFRMGDAEVVLRRSLALEPDSKGFASLAEIELSFNRFKEAMESARRAMAIEPDNPKPYIVMSQASMSLNLNEDADKSWDRAASLSPNLESFLNEKASAYISLGRFAEATEILKKSIGANPLQGEPYYSIICSRRISAQDTAFVSEMTSICENPALKDSERVHLLYGLGKAYDDLSEYERAIAYFDQANQLKQSAKRADQIFDPAGFRHYVDSQIDQYSRDSIEKQSGNGSESSLPVFVVGMMRSGTTLLEQILSRHPQIGGAGEQPFWTQHAEEIKNPVTQEFDVRKLQRLSGQYVESLIRISPNTPRVIDKNPANALIAGLLATAYPHGKVIHIRRHPVDTALSIWMTSMATSADFVNDRQNIVFAYQEYQRVAAHWAAVIPSTRYLEVDYEDLTANPEPLLRRILDFVGLDWDPALLGQDANERAVRTPSFWQVRQPLYRTSVERWRNYEPWLGPFKELLSKSSSNSSR